MALRVDRTRIDDSGGNDLEINSGRSRLYLIGNGFLSCGFDLDVSVADRHGVEIEDGRIIVADVDMDNDVSESRLSVLIEAFDSESEDKLVAGQRVVILKKKDSEWDKETCLQNEDNDNETCASIENGINLVR